MTHAVDYARDVWRRRYFWTALVLLDLKSKYRRSWLGIGWSLANPIAQTCVLCAVFQNVFAIEPSQYLPYVLSGMACWSFLSSSVIEGCLCFYRSENYIRSVRAPLSIYPLRSALGSLVHFGLILLLTMVVIVATRGIDGGASLLSLIPTLCLFVIYAWSMATIFGFVNVFFPDLHHLTGILMQLLFYMTPVFYPPEVLARHRWSALLSLNPLSHFLSLVRDPLLNGQWPAGMTWLVVTSTTALALTAALLMLKRFERRLIFYL